LLPLVVRLSLRTSLSVSRAVLLSDVPLHPLVLFLYDPAKDRQFIRRNQPMIDVAATGALPLAKIKLEHLLKEVL